ncbi:hypothetical protein M2262_000835 [Pseudomonas sp. BIGb0408]|nr:hypothetical protein [Pseudomonas sp. BIGb0408]
MAQISAACARPLVIRCAALKGRICLRLTGRYVKRSASFALTDWHESSMRGRLIAAKTATPKAGKRAGIFIYVFYQLLPMRLVQRAGFLSILQPLRGGRWLALEHSPRYPARVAVNPATGFCSPITQRRTGATVRQQAFFCARCFALWWLCAGRFRARRVPLCPVCKPAYSRHPILFCSRSWRFLTQRSIKP